MKLTAEQLIDTLNLRVHPKEGGYYSETYRSELKLPVEILPSTFTSDKSAATAIYFLLTGETFSAMHRLPTDEIFHFYLGDPVHMLLLHPGGLSERIIIGSDIAAGQRPQLIVPAGVWQGSLLLDEGEFALMGTTMAPGFDFVDYEAGDRTSLQKSYPSEADLITRLTR